MGVANWQFVGNPDSYAPDLSWTAASPDSVQFAVGPLAGGHAEPGNLDHRDQRHLLDRPEVNEQSLKDREPVSAERQPALHSLGPTGHQWELPIHRAVLTGPEHGQFGKRPPEVRVLARRPRDVR